ncbi:hypothetical protein HPB49_010353 [Dermacentor silvarum]|uniref:Uncharacterized protein n=1 Tax=Dermacentor silvarum TaxID=543639 RepID=A0ACB8C8R0_DERSI|nr:hypothetical protein HPB49_010353 [Dermacentor silvarum]
MTVITDVTDWFLSLPVVTRCWFGLSVLFPTLSRFGLVGPQYLVLTYDDFVKGFQIWRPVTAMFCYPMDLHYLENLYILCTYSTRLESGQFGGHPANYLFMLLFNWICIVVSFYVGSWLACLLPSLTRAIAEKVCSKVVSPSRQLLMDPLVLSVLYVWCQLHENVIVNFGFGTQFRDQDREKGPQQSKKDPLPGGRVGIPGKTGQGSTMVQPATLEVRRTGAARNARGVAAILAQQPPQKSLGSPDCAGTAGRDNRQPGQQQKPERPSSARGQRLIGGQPQLAAA